MKLGIEVDGRQHDEPDHRQHDDFRDEYLMEEFGIQVLRIKNSEMHSDVPGVLKRIEGQIGMAQQRLTDGQ